MNNDIYNIDYLQLMPDALKQDEKMIALAKGLAEELLTASGQIKNVLIYSRIDELPEELVDILAYDMHVDWYDYSYPIEAKRRILRDSVKVHKKMGTKYAIEKALGGIYPNSEVEEWFDYQGQPHHFQVICDVTNQYITASYQQIITAIRLYKRLSSWLDGVVYQNSIGVQIGTHTDFYLYHTPFTGRIKTGTFPRRNIKAGVGRGTVVVGTDKAGFIFCSPAAGTAPYRNTVFDETTAYTSADTAMDMIKYNSQQTGRKKAGEIPQRNQEGGLDNMVASATAGGTGTRYTVPIAGTAPNRNQEASLEDKMVDVQTEMTAQQFESKITGTVPHRNTLEQHGNGNLGNTAETAVFHYNIKPCGSTRKL